MVVFLKFFVKETDILITALAGNLFDWQIRVEQKGCRPGEFFCLDDLLEGLAGVFFDVIGKIVGIHMKMIRYRSQGTIAVIFFHVTQDGCDTHGMFALGRI